MTDSNDGDPADMADLQVSLSPLQLRKLMAAAATIGRVATVEDVAAALVDGGVAAVHGTKGVVALVDETDTRRHRYPEVKLPDQRPHALVAVPLRLEMRTVGAWGIRLDVSPGPQVDQVRGRGHQFPVPRERCVGWHHARVRRRTARGAGRPASACTQLADLDRAGQGCAV